MLKLTNDNPRRNAHAASKSNDAFVREQKSFELRSKGSWNQEILSEVVRFLFLNAAQHLRGLNEQRVWTVQNEVRGLVEKREPKVVVR